MTTPEQSRRAGAIRRFASRLRFPQLFLLLAVLFVVDLIVPDAIPFADEIILGLFTTLFGLWRDKRKVASAEGSQPDQPQP